MDEGLPFLRNIASISTGLENTQNSMRDYQWSRVYQTRFFSFIILLFSLSSYYDFDKFHSLAQTNGKQFSILSSNI